MNKNQTRPQTRTKDYKDIKQYPVDTPCELLEFLLKTFSSQSRNSVKSLLSSHRVSVNGAPVSQFNFKLFPKDVVIITKNPIRRKIRHNLPIIFMIIYNKKINTIEHLLFTVLMKILPGFYYLPKMKKSLTY